MIRYLLDTDHVTLHERGHPPILARIATLPPDAIGVSIVTVEETVRGRLAVLAKRSKGEDREGAKLAREKRPIKQALQEILNKLSGEKGLR